VCEAHRARESRRTELTETQGDYYAFLPQFVDPERGTVIGQILLLGVLFALMAICTDGLYALLGSAVGQWLNKSRLIQRWQRAITGCIYILLGVTTAVSGAEKK